MSPSSPHMDLDEFEKRAEAIFKEYFDHGDVQEVAASLEEFNIRNIKHEVSNSWASSLFVERIYVAVIMYLLSLSLSLSRLCVC